ncbi:MAG TPA: trehalase family glycosidase [Verrucomicrobiae bacterium]|jgi:putative isomerase
MNKFIFLVVCLALTAKGVDMPTETQHYIDVIRQNIFKDYKGMLKPAKGNLKHPFITPGNSAYQDQLWDWDSWLTDIALRQIFLENGSDADRQSAFKYEQGCILNFLDSVNGGYIPVVISPNNKNIMDTGGPNGGTNFIQWQHNMHKPCLAQHAAFMVKLNGGDAEWLRDEFPKMQAFVNCYYNHYRNKDTGLYFWETDECIGVDNDPSTFFRPYGSSGSILLNCFMYKELTAMVYLAGRLNQAEIGDSYQKEADALLKSIREHCWDPKDGFYYSVDLNLRPVTQPLDKAWQFHMGQPRNWDCLIQRLGVWSGFLAMWSGVATPEQAKQMVDKNLKDTNTFDAPYGIRSLSKMEKMYDVRATGNPSNWLGPIWVNANYLVFRGLIKYGYKEEARTLAEKTIKLIGMDYEKHGVLHEFYLPDNGEPVMNQGFQDWNLLVLNMIAWYEGKPSVEEF